MPQAITFRMSDRKHPEVLANVDNWRKWRLAYEGGSSFIQAYLKLFSRREDKEDFELRKEISSPEAFAKSSINDLKNAIYQRMSEIKRIGGPDSYQEAIIGKKGGVDKFGKSMNTFIGQEILSELLSIGKVGIFIDRDQINGPLKSDNNGKNPFLYYYCAEDIWSWNFQVGDDGEQYFYNLLLRVQEYSYDSLTGLPTGWGQIFRHFWVNGDGIVQVDDYVWSEGENQDILKATRFLNLKRIPFVVPMLSSSLMKDIADIQIGLMNLNSSDLNYIMRGNIPFYTEQYDAKTENVWGKPPAGIGPVRDANGAVVIGTNPIVENPAAGTAAAADISAQQVISVGAMSGRRYPMGAERPNFISPSSEPLLASMKKQQEMRDKIRILINLGLANMTAQHASAESKGMDDRSMEDGLSAIGQELEWAEREIAKRWAEYENAEPAEINYPVEYNLRSNADRENSAKALKDLKGAVPSRTFGKEVSKEINKTLLGGKISNDVLDTINKEIDEANYVTSDAAEIQMDLESGIVGPETASNARGYDGKKEVDLAQEFQTKRLQAIAIAQTAGKGAAASNGIKDGAPNATIEKDNTQDPALNPTGGGALTRGK